MGRKSKDCVVAKTPPKKGKKRSASTKTADVFLKRPKEWSETDMHLATTIASLVNDHATLDKYKASLQCSNMKERLEIDRVMAALIEGRHLKEWSQGLLEAVGHLRLKYSSEVLAFEANFNDRLRKCRDVWEARPFDKSKITTESDC